MILILTVTLPLFVLILAGYVSRRSKLIDQAGVRGLTGFVFYFALPLMLFHNMATAPLAEHFDGRYVLAYLGAGLSVHLSGMAVARWVFRCPLSEQAIQGIAVSFGNLVFIALPIATEVFGPEAALPMALLIVVENGILMPFTVGLLEIERAGPGKIWRAPLTAFNAILRSPIVTSVLLGAGVALLEIQLPSILDSIVRLVRGANVPCALFALGATLAGLPLTERVRETGFMVVWKLLAYPALVFLGMSLIPDLAPSWLAIAVISAAMPMGANVYLVAARYDSYLARASTGVLVSTVVSVVSISVLVVLLAGAG
jgi:predicted permease